ncbi:MAG: hypothetical protein ACREVE_04675 [Gammaproteobacteria bacterium]
MESSAKFILLCALWLMSSSAPASENYCRNPAVDAEWERLLVRHEGDPAFTYLYSLRQDLCDKVDQRTITLNDAIDHFEAERQRVIDERQERLQERRGSAASAG